ncbi:MAG: molybdenum cofactor guanylyltransferase [Bacteroidota bacterium]
MIGLVLSGGRSMRMGADKGLLLHDGNAWAEVARKKLNAIFPVVLISVNADHYERYQALFEEKILVKDHYEIAVQGPLLGILSAHTQNPEEDFLVIACDLLMMESLLIEKLVNLYSHQPGYEAYIFTHEQGDEPLCSIYTGKALSRIYQLYQQNPNLKNGLKYMLNQLDVLKIPLEESKVKYFTNFNDQETLNNL